MALTYYVNDIPTGDDSNPGTPTEPFATLNAAMSAASNGDTIIVKNRALFAYTEEAYFATITKNLTIEGRRDPLTGDYPIIFLPLRSYGFNVTSPCTIKNFYILKFHKWNIAVSKVEYAFNLNNLSGGTVTLENIEIIGKLSEGTALLIQGSGSETVNLTNIRAWGFNSRSMVASQCTLDMQGCVLESPIEFVNNVTAVTRQCAFNTEPTLGSGCTIERHNAQDFYHMSNVQNSGLYTQPYFPDEGDFAYYEGDCCLLYTTIGRDGPGAAIAKNRENVVYVAFSPPGVHPDGGYPLNSCTCISREGGGGKCVLWDCCANKPYLHPEVSIESNLNLATAAANNYRVVFFVSYQVSRSYEGVYSEEHPFKLSVGGSAPFYSPARTIDLGERDGRRCWIIEFTSFPTSGTAALQLTPDARTPSDKGLELNAEPNIAGAWTYITGGLFGLGYYRPYFWGLDPDHSETRDDLPYVYAKLKESGEGYALDPSTVSVEAFGTVYSLEHLSDDDATLTMTYDDPTEEEIFEIYLLLTIHKDISDYGSSPIVVTFRGADAVGMWADPLVAVYFMWNELGTVSVPYDITDQVVYKNPAPVMEPWDHCYDMIEVHWGFGEDSAIVRRGVEKESRKVLSIDNSLIQLSNLAALTGDLLFEKFSRNRKAISQSMTFQPHIELFDVCRIKFPDRYYNVNPNRLWVTTSFELSPSTGVIKFKGFESYES